MGIPLAQNAPAGATHMLWAGSIFARPHWTDVPVSLEAGKRYFLRASGEWLDWKTRSPANGYSNNSLGWASFALRCRLPGATWFTLIGSVGRTTEHQFVIGDGSRWAEGWVATSSGPLCCFANDVPMFYWNNHGALTLEVWV